MRIHRLELEQFRNYRQFQRDFHPDLNLIYGDNGQGKTNLLEAIAYLSTGRSYRARYDREMIMFQKEWARVRGNLFRDQRGMTLEIQLQQKQKRRMWCNGVDLRTGAELSGLFQTVIFCPEDLQLIQEGAGVRRRFLDQAICQLRPKYVQALALYHRLQAHKSRILKDWRERPSLLQTLDTFNGQMIQAGAQLIYHRAHFVKRLMQTAPEIHQSFSGRGEKLTLCYRTVSTIEDPLAPLAQLVEQLHLHQERHKKGELEARQCLSGPHRDDLQVELDGQPARAYGSQGQIRTAAISLKLAQREIFFQETGEYPVLLLDDILSELDGKRQAFVLHHIQGGQVFITCCEEAVLDGLDHGESFHIQQGTWIGSGTKQLSLHREGEGDVSPSGTVDHGTLSTGSGHF